VFALKDKKVLNYRDIVMSITFKIKLK